MNWTFPSHSALKVSKTFSMESWNSPLHKTSPERGDKHPKHPRKFHKIMNIYSPYPWIILDHLGSSEPSSSLHHLIELDYGKIYRKALYLMVKTMVSCRFSLKPIQASSHNSRLILMLETRCWCRKNPPGVNPTAEFDILVPERLSQFGRRRSMGWRGGKKHLHPLVI